MPNDNHYEDHPWEDDPIIGNVVNNVLPPAGTMKQSVFLITAGDQQFFSFPKQDMQALEIIAQKTGNTPADLISNLVHSYVQSHA
jgi:hypothetical protein